MKLSKINVTVHTVLQHIIMRTRKQGAGMRDTKHRMKSLAALLSAPIPLQFALVAEPGQLIPQSNLSTALNIYRCTRSLFYCLA